MLGRLGSQDQNPFLLMDRAYEGNETRQLALTLGFTPVVPPRSARVDPWQYDREMYKRRNEIERLFRRLKGFRRIFSRFEKLDTLFPTSGHSSRRGESRALSVRRHVYTNRETPSVAHPPPLHCQGALYGILDIIKTDPLADYDKFVQAFQDPGTVLEI